MSYYPSLEDMKLDQLGKAQTQLANEVMSAHGLPYPTSPQQTNTLPYPMPASTQDLSHLYPTLNEYMGLEFTQELLAQNMPEYASLNQGAVAVPQGSAVAIPSNSTPAYGMIAPISGNSRGLHQAQVNHGIRQLTLCKDKDGRVGIRVKDINKGCFVCLVKKESPAAIAGLRFGDQILQINDVNLAGFSTDKVHSILKKCPTNGITVAVRDRPFERTVTLQKDSVGHLGFNFRDGQINAIVKDSSSARNGLLTEHQILEINGQNVVGVKDKQICQMIEEGGHSVTVTVMPSFVFKHMMDKMASSLTKIMDHSVPNL